MLTHLTGISLHTVLLVPFPSTILRFLGHTSLLSSSLKPKDFVLSSHYYYFTLLFPCQFFLIPETTDNHFGLFIELLGTHWLRMNAVYTCSCRRRQLIGTTSLGRCASRSPSHHLPSTLPAEMTLVFTLSLSLFLIWSWLPIPWPDRLSCIVPLGTRLNHVGTLLVSLLWREVGNHRQMLFAWGWGGGGIGVEGNFWAFYPYQKANLGGWGVCAGEALGYITDAASLGAFSYFRFHKEHWTGRISAFPTCMTIFLCGGEGSRDPNFLFF